MTTITGSARRFGSRYGRKIRNRLEKIESEQRKLHKCPFCHYIRVKRVSNGIWLCQKCNIKFTSKAYTVAKIPVVKAEVEGAA
ncbi:MAG: 50S ribosomal protein L37ae [Nanoarchaeota archaeon]|nr:50S ribosomal protein L37ae [Nanoarchaeota archaeon]MBU1030780.1 50S ribosomal protein L37ae [Nanoarchaeota archaeon]MBU1850512.1 50S ribosomal protein L37ae [Nanoarchaeota archaeon]